MNLKLSFTEMENRHIRRWKEERIFQKSLEKRADSPKYVFFDGPPFANGLPHYGHILAGTLKDAVTRYFSMKGFYVPRINGWDCHGLPVEYEIEKNQGLSGRKDIEAMGIENFNLACRESVFQYTHQWDDLIDRMGRWVDKENRYATLDTSYMESIWWVFKSIWDKGLIYQGFKSMHVCPRCVTPLSNFEVSQAYQDVTDYSVIVKFPSKEEDNLYFLAWTTTPWSLPGNAALALGQEISYQVIQFEGSRYVLAKDLVESVFKDKEFERISESKGADWQGHAYEAPFAYYQNEYKNHEGAWRVINEDFVTTESGTGIVHVAGAFGEDDLQACLSRSLPVIHHVKMDGTFEAFLDSFAGKFAKNQDQEIVKYLKSSGAFFSGENYRHSYPHCWRCDTPLLNYASKAWFVKVTEVKDSLLKNNEKIHWQPSHIQKGRFGKWLENARDWNISRNRFWGTPIPIWECQSCGKFECIGSVEALKEKAKTLPQRGEDLDLHIPYIDELKWPCDCSGEMKRIPEVLDCWFESGAMPYAQLHYPFENKEFFENNFPADFIAEGLDQTRGWFYTLHVLSTILFDKPAFKNVIVNGILLAADGEKLSKRKKNYPDPGLLFEEKGVDSLRLFLCSSTAPIGEDVRFSDKHVDEVVKKMTLTLWNTYSFYRNYAEIDGFEPEKKIQALEHFSNPLDQWILSELEALVQEMTKQMDSYNLPAATRPIFQFVDSLSNWYLRRSRRRFWKTEKDSDKEMAYQCLYQCLRTLSLVLAPIMPFISEEIYLGLGGEESVHLQDWPQARDIRAYDSVRQEMNWIRQIVTLGHSVRAAHQLKVRQPLSEMILVLPPRFEQAIIEKQKDVILEELNIKKILFESEAAKFADLVAEPNARVLGPKYGSSVQDIIRRAKEGNFSVLETGEIQMGEWIFSHEEISLAYKGKDGLPVGSLDGVVAALNTELTPELIAESWARDLIRYVQDIRKKANYHLSDHIVLGVQGPKEIEDRLLPFVDMIKEELLCDEWKFESLAEYDFEQLLEMDAFELKVHIRRV